MVDVCEIRALGSALNGEPGHIDFDDAAVN